MSYSERVALAETLLPKPKLPDPLTWAPLDANFLIKTPREAINAFDFEAVARQNVQPVHFGYVESGIDDEFTLRANREDFAKFELRPRPKQLTRLISALYKGDILVVTHLDRLARSTRDLLNLLSTVAERGGSFKSLRDS